MSAQEVFDAEERAAKMLERWWWSAGRSLPVDPLVLASDLGIRVRRADLPADQSGIIVMKRDITPVITLNRSDSPNRQRFTAAHELGHYERRSLGSDGLLDSDGEEHTDYRDTLAGLGTSPKEVFSNQFAAAILMPATDVRRLFRTGRTADEMARTFGTSPQAMKLRIKNLRLA